MHGTRTCHALGGPPGTVLGTLCATHRPRRATMVAVVELFNPHGPARQPDRACTAAIGGAYPLLAIPAATVLIWVFYAGHNFGPGYAGIALAPLIGLLFVLLITWDPIGKDIEVAPRTSQAETTAIADADADEWRAR
jgi:hypothetical protein